MNIVSFGGGTNSAALLIGLYKHKIPIDLITFADTGAEHPHTYQFIEIINQWLAEHGMPQITVVQYVDRYGNRLSLETECLRSHTLPSIAYGHKRCSQKHKIAPQEKFCNHYAPCREVWQRGEKVNRYIGYDAGEVKRYEHSRKYNEADKKYHNRYPLIEEWGWNRDDCIREIKAAGLPQPGKSSCFFCPSMKKQEILYLKEHYPDLFNRAATLEENAICPDSVSAGGAANAAPAQVKSLAAGSCKASHGSWRTLRGSLFCPGGYPYCWYAIFKEQRGAIRSPSLSSRKLRSVNTLISRNFQKTF